MTTNLVLDEKLIFQAQKIGNHKTKKDAVTTALKEYIARKKLLEITELFGKINFDNNYDYKKARTSGSLC
ncbi:MAG TPA: type II toxin-antitoxin system VapB family antitoxin [Candidatus Brocadiaceae bacterium]|nr:type II toxin-antitoxin system VapB family antitoxin [Candidatus Brocadiaceae bacterium]